MDENSEIKILLHKFILNQCSLEETNKVVGYFTKNNQTTDFPTVEEVQVLLNTAHEIDSISAEKIFSSILISAKEIENTEIKTIKIYYKKYIAIAASIIILLSVGLLYQNNSLDKNKNIVLENNKITLQLANGDVQVISENKTNQVLDAQGKVIGNQNKNKIIYNSESSLQKLVYNTIKIPYGKRFELQLSDGTHVHLNSGTTLKYPVNFITGQNRQVFLNGEAFFDVAKDKKHPFIVNSNNLNVRVLGTHFNVSSYPEDNLTDVVLVEGSVGLYTKNETFNTAKSTILKPGYKASFDKTKNSMDSQAVVTEVHTSWISGKLTFRNTSFKDIAKKLERHYNVSIVNQNTKLANEKFYATFNGESIEKVLSYFNEIHGLDYTVKNNQIVIR